MEFHFLTYIKPDGTPIEIIRSKEDGSLWISAPSLALLYGMEVSWVRRKLHSEVAKTSPENGSVSAKLASTGKDGKKYEIEYFQMEFVLNTAIGNGSDLKPDFQKWVTQNSQPKMGKIIRYHLNNQDIEVRVSPNRDTVWLTQEQIAQLHGRSQPNISMHLRNIFRCGELEEEAVHKKFLYTATDGKTYLTDFYNLSAILAVGYRVNSKRGIQFRNWASIILSDHLKNLKPSSSNPPATQNDILSQIYYVLNEHSNRFDTIEKKIEYYHPSIQLIETGHYFEAYLAAVERFKLAKRTIAIIDAYADDTLFKYLQKASPNIKALVYCDRPSRFSVPALEAFEKEHFPIVITELKNVHDRYVIIDDEHYYALGTSLTA
ncbi:MAG: virulence RhuM family protein [Bacilli bacterium]|nr:virulence RhuM family protein [Bacilli bacterium]